ncbi:tetratricopeptide repeat protein [Paenibacillus thalictri]|uniref:tetratricopeptide repeat protein n=1 Tax=Paenibacillus thalictri TaxID=2527873 RepID=UPI0013EF0843|nr:tetratricopeptide repeat protein [Paenibacillus thalictri]
MKENKVAFILIPILLIAAIAVYFTMKVPDEVETASSCYSQATAAVQSQKWEDAKKQLNQCKLKYQGDGKFDFQLGNVARMQNQMDQALTYYLSALGTSPQLIEAYNNAAAIKMLQNKLDDAMSIIEDGLKQKPDYKDLNFKKGQLLYLKQQYTQVVPLLEPLVGDPEYFEAYRFLGLSQYKLGQKPQALNSLAEYLQKASPTTQGLQEIERIVAELKSP